MLDQVKIQKEREDVEKVKNDNLITEIQNTDNFLTIKVSSMYVNGEGPALCDDKDTGVLANYQELSL